MIASDEDIDLEFPCLLYNCFGFTNPSFYVPPNNGGIFYSFRG